MSKVAEVEIFGRVTRIWYNTPTFIVGTVVGLGGRSSTFSTTTPCSVGDRVWWVGFYETEGKYKGTFRVQESRFAASYSGQDLAEWLAEKVTGFGDMAAAHCSMTYGDNFASILVDDPARVVRDTGVPTEVVLRARRLFAENRDYCDSAIGLKNLGLTTTQINEVMREWPTGALAVVHGDPYRLLDIDGIGWKTAEKVAEAARIQPADTRRIRAALLQAVREIEQDGSTVADRQRVRDAYEKLVGRDTVTADALSAIGRSLIADGVLDAVGSFVARPRTLNVERQIAYAAHGIEVMEGLPPAPAYAVDPHDPALAHLEPTQVAAVRTALNHRVSVVTGGAGTGKTTIIRAIYEIHSRAGRLVSLCAPTGKAARRLTEVVGASAQTIHRTLAYGPIQLRNGRIITGFRHNAASPLAAHVVIVDEASMADSRLLSHLLDAVLPTTQVVLVGDPNQLPPVGAGAPFRDLIASDQVPVARLTHCHRQAGPLYHNCHMLLRGVLPPTVKYDKETLGPWYCKDTPKKEDLEKLIENLLFQACPRWHINPWEQIQFVVPGYAGWGGGDALNAYLQRLRQQQLMGPAFDAAPAARKKYPFVGDKVINTKNNYETGVMNGEQGVVREIDIAEDGRNFKHLIVDFGDRQVVYAGRSTQDLMLAYALTAHKMQGSQCPVVVVVGTAAHSRIMHRTWLYTACTRAQQTCILAGEEWAFRAAAGRVEADTRITALPKFLSGEWS